MPDTTKKKEQTEWYYKTESAKTALRGGMATIQPSYKNCIGCTKRPYCARCTRRYGE